MSSVAPISKGCLALATAFLRANVQSGMPAPKPVPKPVDLCGPLVLCPTPFWAALEYADRIDPPVWPARVPSHAREAPGWHACGSAQACEADTTFKTHARSEQQACHTVPAKAPMPPTPREVIHERTIARYTVQRMPLTGRIVDLVV